MCAAAAVPDKSCMKRLYPTVFPWSRRVAVVCREMKRSQMVLSFA